MEDTNLESVVAEFARDHLSPTEDERRLIARRYEQLQGFLEVRTLQNGSYARFTSTTPVNDLDVIWIMPEELLKTVRTAQQAIDVSRINIRQALEGLAKELRKLYGQVASVELQPHSVGIFFGEKHEFSIDVVPAAPAAGDMFWIPEVGRHSVANRRAQYRAWQSTAPTVTAPGPNWIRTHPRGYIQQASALDLATEGRFRKTAKLLKRWRWGRKRADDTFALKSFHLELAITRWMQANPEADCVEAIRAVLAELEELIARPSIRDLADSTRFVDQYVALLSDAERTLLQKEFAQAQYLWAEVERGKTEASAEVALKRFLGLVVGGPTGVSAPPPAVVAVAPTGAREGKEEFLSDRQIPYRPQYRIKIDAIVTKNGWRPYKLLARVFPLLGKLKNLEFFVTSTTVPEPFAVIWKVKNTGIEAREKGQLRGQLDDDKGKRRKNESTLYWGNHYVECYAVKDGICVAADHLEVPIGATEAASTEPT